MTMIDKNDYLFIALELSGVSSGEKAYLRSITTDKPIQEWLSHRRELGMKDNIWADIYQYGNADDSNTRLDTDAS